MLTIDKNLNVNRKFEWNTRNKLETLNHNHHLMQIKIEWSNIHQIRDFFSEYDQFFWDKEDFFSPIYIFY